MFLSSGDTGTNFEEVFSPIWVNAEIETSAMNAMRNEYSMRLPPRSSDRVVVLIVQRMRTIGEPSNCRSCSSSALWR